MGRLRPEGRTAVTLVGAARAPLSPGGPDAEIAGRIRERDESALREVVAEHGGRVLGIARRVLRDPARAEEVAQDTFVSLWVRPEAFDPARGSLRSFLAGIAHHKAVDQIRKQEVRDRASGRLLEGEGGLVGAGSVPNPDPDAGAEVRRAVRALSPKLRETLFLAFYMGFTYREVALELGIPEGTAKSRIRDALSHLREELSLRVEV
jgi:RNA polymerase sigma factor (sigma-70 family)